MFHTPNREKILSYAKEIRVEILKMLNTAGSGHAAGSLGMTDVFTTLYFSGLLKYDPKNPKMTDRDVVILSNAHICPVYYSVLSYAGYFEKTELMTLRKFGSRLQGHSSNHWPDMGIESSGGPLSQGMSVAVGFALSAAMSNKSRHVYCFCSDGELNEGQAWEAFMSANKFKLNNLTFVIDRNNIQIDGKSDDVMPLEPLHEKLKAFGLDTLDVDGHNIDKIFDAFTYAKDKLEPLKTGTASNQPTVLIMHTIPGKGVSFMENDYHWHGKVPNNDELKLAIAEIMQG